MTYVYPDFYKDFKCISSNCRHSCCRGWEIDIDDKTMELYENIDGELGQKLKKSISYDPEPHFILTEDESCPFLCKDGLCRIISELGEDSLCDICSEHPRFYNEYPGRLEAGPGLCCEEAVRLLTQGTHPLEFIEETDGEEDDEPLTPELKMRSRVLMLLCEQGKPLTERMKDAAELYGVKLKAPDCAEVAEFYSSLERMDEAWGKSLTKLSKCREDTKKVLDGIRYERIAEYFIYRHFAAFESAESCKLRLLFAFLSTWIVACLEASGEEDALRMYSCEIEYSDENVDAILTYIKTIKS